MARVKATQARNVTQYKDEAGHRLPSRKGLWWENFAGYYEADCPKCPEPEPVGECDAPEYHEVGRWWYRFCPRCGQRLLADPADAPGASPGSQEREA